LRFKDRFQLAGIFTIAAFEGETYRVLEEKFIAPGI
jgi:hypothetical protein